MNEPRRVIIRTDASTEIGSGHVMRCLTLAGGLRARGAEITFVGRACEGNYLEHIRSKGFRAVPLAADDARAPLPAEAGPADWLVVDHYALDAAWETSARGAARRILVIDDLANRPHDCDLLLDQNIVSGMETRYGGLVPPACRLLLGPSYALLRTEFHAARPRPRDGGVGRVLVFFGGADPNGLTVKTLEALGALADRPAVDVVIGLAYRDGDAIRESCGRYGFTLHVQTDRMLQLLDEADLVIGAGGTATWERCKLGVPSVTVVAADNQRDITEAVAARGATVNIGDAASFSPAKVSEALTRLSKDPQAVRKMSESAAALINGGKPGVERVIDAMREAA